jgi:L-histidine N-alpha-methyltransferase
MLQDTRLELLERHVGTAGAPIAARILTTGAQLRATVAAAALESLATDRPSLPTELLYLGAGGARFGEVARDPRYRLARREHALVRRTAEEVAAVIRPEHVLELCGGASDKLALLAAAAAPHHVTCVDIDEPGLVDALEHIRGRCASIRSADVIVADLWHPELELPRHGRRLALLLGSTIGNFDEAGRGRLLGRIAARSVAGGGVLVGLDLNANPRSQVATYRSRSVELFNRESFRTLADLTGSNLSPDDVRHVARWDDGERAICVELVTTREVVVGRGERAVAIAAGTVIRTATSRKLAIDQVDAELAAAGFSRSTWWFDDGRLHALVLGRVD